MRDRCLFWVFVAALLGSANASAATTALIPNSQPGDYVGGGWAISQCPRDIEIGARVDYRS